METPLPRPASLNGGTAIYAAAGTPPEPSGSCRIAIEKSTTAISKRKSAKKKQPLASDSTSSASSSNCCRATSYSRKGIKISANSGRIRMGSLIKCRKSIGPSDVDALGLPLGMSIAAVVAQVTSLGQSSVEITAFRKGFCDNNGMSEVLERKNATGEKISVDYLSEICILAVGEALENVFGDKFDNFVVNFEKSFRSTLMTLRLINDSSQNTGEKLRRGNPSYVLSLDKQEDPSCSSGAMTHLESHNQRSRTKLHPRVGCQENSLGEVTSPMPFNGVKHLNCLNDSMDVFDPLPHRISTSGESCCNEQLEENLRLNLRNQQMVLLDRELDRQVAKSSNSSINQSSMLSVQEKSLMEQTRTNDLKSFEISLIMKKLQLKEKQLAINSHANFLERWKLSMGFSKASFKAEKFKTQLQDTRQIELLRKCLDFLVAGLIIMLVSIVYGTYVYSHRRIIEAIEACSPHTESKSWWMPKSMANFDSGLQLLKCQIQVLSRMLFGALMIAAIAFLRIERSSASHHTMPVTFILLLLGVMCGYAGKFCIDTLGGSGYCWLMHWEALCLLHFFSNIFGSTLYVILNGPVAVGDQTGRHAVFPYWIRRLMFFAVLLVLPLLCGFMPFAGLKEWLNHFSLLMFNF